jgi:hypothetical protein
MLVQVLGGRSTNPCIVAIPLTAGAAGAAGVAGAAFPLPCVAATVPAAASSAAAEAMRPVRKVGIDDPPETEVMRRACRNVFYLV